MSPVHMRGQNPLHRASSPTGCRRPRGALQPILVRICLFSAGISACFLGLLSLARCSACELRRTKTALSRALGTIWAAGGREMDAPAPLGQTPQPTRGMLCARVVSVALQTRNLVWQEIVG